MRSSSWLKALRARFAVALGRKASTRGRRTKRPLAVGRFEERVLLSVLTVTNNSDTGVSGDGSLRGEIAAAQSGDSLVFAPSLAGETITLTQGSIAITQGLTITGLGANQLTVSGNNQSEVFNIGSDAVVNVSGLSLIDGNGVYGGAIYTQGVLTVTNSYFANNHANIGGAIYSRAEGSDPATGQLTVTDDTFSNNSADWSGAIDNWAGGTIIVTNSTFAGNSANEGGAIKNEWGTLEVADSTFYGNSATSGSNGPGNGGAIDNENGYPLVLQNSIIAGNTAVNSGPDIDGPISTDNGYNAVGNTSGSSGLTGSNDTLNVTTLVWDGGASGTWSTSTADWQVNGSGSAVDWTNGDVAVFGTANAAVTISGGVTADAVVFNNSGITVSSSTLTLGAGDGIVSTMLGDSATISSVVAGSVGLYTDNGGTLVLSGANTYTGATTVTGGTLSISADNNLGADPGSTTAGNIVINGGTLQATSSFTLNSNRGIALGPTSGAGGGTFDVTGGDTLTYGGILANNGSGTGSLTMTDSGTLTLSGSNTYTGGTTLRQGTLVNANNNATGPVTAPITIGDTNTGSANTTLEFTVGITNNGDDTTYKPITVNNVGGTTTFLFNQGFGGASTSANINIDTSKAITLATTGSQNQNGMMGTISGSGAGAGNTTVTFSDTGGGTFYYTAGYSGSGVVQKSFAGNVVFAAGRVAVQNLGFINAAYTNGDFPSTASVTVDSGATWAQQWGSQSIDGLNGSGTVDISGSSTGPVALTIGASGGSGTFSGVVQGSGGSLIKTGTGTETLSGANTYSGTTTVNGGTLDITGSVTNSAITVNSPGSLIVTVVNTSDSGPGSLRQAIATTNDTTGVTPTINFGIPGGGVQTIQPHSPLPAITEPVTINGYSQPGSSPNTLAVGDNAVLDIQINGSQAGSGSGIDGFVVNASGSLIEGLVINGFSGYGIYVSGASATANVITGDFIGTDPTGMIAVPNGHRGVYILNGASYNRVGTNGDGINDPAERNLISGNTVDGLALGTNADYNIVSGNYIGTNATGTQALGNLQSGIAIFNAASYNVIGTNGANPDQGNVISGNGGNGVYMENVGSIYDVIAGNDIGTDATGTTIVRNGEDVLLTTDGVTGGPAYTVINDNVISGSGADGIDIAYSTNTIVTGNYIGTNATGTAALANAGNGVLIEDGSTGNTIGGTSAAARNVISGNSSDGVDITGNATTGNVVEGNYIGTNAAGSAALGNAGRGIDLGSGASSNTIGGNVTGAGNLISGNQEHGVELDSGVTDTLIEGNLIGLDATGSFAVGNGNNHSYAGIAIFGASSTTIGGTTSSARNVISGNQNDGIGMLGTGTDGTLIEGNYVGTNSAGTAAVGNGQPGIDVLDEVTHTAILDNLISGNAGGGILVSNYLGYGAPTGTVIQGNEIGTNASGTAAIPNSVMSPWTGFGIELDKVAGVIVGGTSATARNVISGNAGDGIDIDGSAASGNVIEGNYIGTNAGGTAAVGNGANGVEISSSNNTIGAAGAGNIISGNANNGVVVDATGSSNTIEANYIGTNAAGTAAIGNGTGVALYGPNNIVGAPSAGNVISGSTSFNGIWADSTGNAIQANYVGTNATGTASLGNIWDGIGLGAASNTIGGTAAGAGNVISGDARAGIAINVANDNLIEGNRIGTDPTGSFAVPNGLFGIWMDGSSNTIGGTTVSGRNIISGNNGYGGIVVQVAGNDDNVIQGNYIGVNAAGTALGNSGPGIYVAGGSNTIGGTAAGAGNVISSNSGVGIQLDNTGAIANVVQGNYIGTNATGTAALGNGWVGVLIDSGASDNLIGADGSSAIADAAARNIISGNGWDGVQINAANNNVVAGNYIGLDVTGAIAIPNANGGASGVAIFNGSSNNRVGTSGAEADNAGERNVIAGSGDGVFICDGNTTGNLVAGNYIGLNAAGTAARPNNYNGIYVQAPDNTIGGTTAGMGNVISGNSGAGILFNGGNLADGNPGTFNAAADLVEGNYIGTNAAGTGALANTGNGILIENGANDITIGGPSAGAGNVISANNGYGVVVGPSQPPPSGDAVEDNSIGAGGLLNGAGALEILSNGTAVVAGTFYGSVVDNGTLDLYGNNASVIGSFTGSGTVTNNGSGTATLALNGTGIFPGVIQNGTIGSVALEVAGGTVTLAGANTYSGTTTIDSGATLNVSRARPTSGAATASLGHGSVLDNGLLEFSLWNNSTVSNDISGSGGLTQAAIGVVTLSGDNTYTGTTTINSGDTLQAGSATAFSSASAISDSGTLNLAGFLDHLGPVTGTGTVTNNVVHVYQDDNGVAGFGSGDSVYLFNNSLGSEAEDNWVGNVFTAVPGSLELSSVTFLAGSALDPSDLPSPYITVALYTGAPGAGLTLVPGSVNTVPLNATTDLQTITVPFAATQQLTAGEVFTAALLIDDVPTTVYPFVESTLGTNASSYYDVSRPPGNGNTYNLASPNGPTPNGAIYPGTSGTNAAVCTTVLRVNAITPAPNLSLSASTINESSTTTLSGIVTGPVTTASHSVQIHWGDGSTSTVNLASGILNYSASHLYLNNLPGNAPYTITATVTDTNGDNDPALLVGDPTQPSGHAVKSYDLTDGNLLASLTSPTLQTPSGMAIGPDGNLYVSSFDNNEVERYNPITGQAIGVFASGGGLRGPEGLAFYNGNLFVSSSGTGQVLEYNGTSGAYMGIFATGNGSTGPLNLQGVAFGPDGNLYVADGQANGSVQEYNGTTGAYIGAYVPFDFDTTVQGVNLVGGPDHLEQPTALLFGPDGNLYVASFLNNSVMEFAGPNQAHPGSFLSLAVSNGVGGLAGPIGLAFGSDGTLYVAGETSNNVIGYDGASVFTLATVNAPTSLLFLPPQASTISVTVLNVPPTNAAVSATPTDIQEGSSITIAGSFTDTGIADAHTVVLNFGDGTVDTVALPPTNTLYVGQTITGSDGTVLTITSVDGNGDISFANTHRYLDEPEGQSQGSDTISFTVTDQDNASASATTSIEVDAVPPTLTIAPSSSQGVPTEGLSFTFHPLSPSPTDQAGTFTYVVSWGDGTSAMTYHGPAGMTVTYAYATIGSYSISATATDDGGETSAAASANVTISTAALTDSRNMILVGDSSTTGGTPTITITDLPTSVTVTLTNTPHPSTTTISVESAGFQAIQVYAPAGYVVDTSAVPAFQVQLIDTSAGSHTYMAGTGGTTLFTMGNGTDNINLPGGTNTLNFSNAGAAVSFNAGLSGTQTLNSQGAISITGSGAFQTVIGPTFSGNKFTAALPTVNTSGVIMTPGTTIVSNGNQDSVTGSLGTTAFLNGAGSTFNQILTGATQDLNAFGNTVSGGGGFGNSGSGNGGFGNTITVGGGGFNTINASVLSNVTIESSNNTYNETLDSTTAAVLEAAFGNTLSGGGGFGNTPGGSGGFGNTLSGTGGFGNTLSGAGGFGNTVTVGGGGFNTIKTSVLTNVTIDSSNNSYDEQLDPNAVAVLEAALSAFGNSSSGSGGFGNSGSGSGGYGNVLNALGGAFGNSSSGSGGFGNTQGGGGGFGNTVTVGGGGFNTIETSVLTGVNLGNTTNNTYIESLDPGAAAIIEQAIGSFGNTVSGGGGFGNTVSGGGGFGNTMGGSGGFGNTVSGGGGFNTILTSLLTSAMVGGNHNNFVQAVDANSASVLEAAIQNAFGNTQPGSGGFGTVLDNLGGLGNVFLSNGSNNTVVAGILTNVNITGGSNSFEQTLDNITLGSGSTTTTISNYAAQVIASAMTSFGNTLSGGGGFGNTLSGGGGFGNSLGGGGGFGNTQTGSGGFGNSVTIGGGFNDIQTSLLTGVVIGGGNNTYVQAVDANSATLLDSAINSFGNTQSGGGGFGNSLNQLGGFGNSASIGGGYNTIITSLLTNVTATGGNNTYYQTLNPIPTGNGPSISNSAGQVLDDAISNFGNTATGGGGFGNTVSGGGGFGNTLSGGGGFGNTMGGSGGFGNTASLGGGYNQIEVSLVTAVAVTGTDGNNLYYQTLDNTSAGVLEAALASESAAFGNTSSGGGGFGNTVGGTGGYVTAITNLGGFGNTATIGGGYNQIETSIVSNVTVTGSEGNNHYTQALDSNSAAVLAASIAGFGNSLGGGGGFGNTQGGGGGFGNTQGGGGGFGNSATLPGGYNTISVGTLTAVTATGGYNTYTQSLDANSAQVLSDVLAEVNSFGNTQGGGGGYDTAVSLSGYGNTASLGGGYNTAVAGPLTTLQITGGYDTFEEQFNADSLALVSTVLNNSGSFASADAANFGPYVTMGDGNDVAVGGLLAHVQAGNGADRFVVEDPSLLTAAAADANAQLLQFGGSFTGGAGANTYYFVGNDIGHVQVNQGETTSIDTLDFSHFQGGGVSVNIAQTSEQQLTPGLLWLSLSDDMGISNVVGTGFSDTITGNGRDGTIEGQAPLDPRDANPTMPPTNPQQQIVYLDFTTYTIPATQHVYDSYEEEAILNIVQSDYAALGFVTFTLQKPTSGTYSTIFINEPTSQSEGGAGGLADQIDWRNLDLADTAAVNANGFIGNQAGEIPAGTADSPSDTWIPVTATIIAHETGHTLGLDHGDAYGPISFGINSTPGNAGYLPPYPGPSAAFETTMHLIASPASVGSTLEDAAGHPFFGERESIKLEFSQDGTVIDDTATPPAVPNSTPTSENSVAGGGTTSITTGISVAQALPLMPMYVANDATAGWDYGMQYQVAGIDVVDHIGLDSAGTSKANWYSFSGDAGDDITLQTFSRALMRITDGVDTVLTVYNSSGQVVGYYGGTATNYDDPLTADAVIDDLILPASGTYYVEVSALQGITNTSSPGYNPQEATDTETGTYELLIYRASEGNPVNSNSHDTIIPGSGQLTVIGTDPTNPIVTPQTVTINGVYGSPLTGVQLANFDSQTFASDLATVDWGDGTSGQAAISPSGQIGDVLGSHTYAHAGTYTFTVTITQGGDISVVLQGKAIISPAAITYQIGNDGEAYGTAANLAHDLGTTIPGVNGQTLDIAYSSSGDTNTADVKTGGYTITGALSNGTGLTSDYTVTLTSGTLTVNPYAFSYQIGNDSQIYGTPANLGTDLGTTIPGVNGQNLDVAYSSAGDTSTASVGTYPITATLSNGTGLTSDYTVTLKSGTLTVGQLSTTTTITSSSAHNSSGFGQSVTLTAAVSDATGVTPTGSVDFFDTTTGTDLGSFSLGNGKARVSTATLPVGNDVITATYGGTTTFAGSTNSLTQTQTVLVSAYALSTTGTTAALSGNAILNVPGVFVDYSSSSSSVTVGGNAQIKASLGVQVVGGVQKSGSGSISPAPVTISASSAVDPLAGLAAPSASALGLNTYAAENVSGNASTSIPAGVYPSIAVSGNGKLTLQAGIYIITGGGFTVSGNASVTGMGVFIYNAGSNYPNTGGKFGSLSLSGNGVINLTAPTTGTYAGLLVFQSRDNTQAVGFSGNGAVGMSGTIYAPAAQAVLSGNSTLSTSVLAASLSISGNAIANLSAGDGGVAYTPAQIRTAYGVNSLALDGTGQTIAIVDAYDDPTIYQSLETFDSQFGLTTSGPSLYDLYGPAATFLTVLNQSGQAANLPATDPAGLGDNWEAESALDVEWVHALAPGAQIVLVEANSQSLSDLMSAVGTAATQPGVSVVSMSWGFPEGQDVLAADEATYDSTLTQPGVTFVASTGDYGVADPEYPAFSPNVVAVGGTSLTLNSDNSYNGETGWGYNSASYGAFIGSGGGISQYESEPAYQQGVQGTGNRTTPDVSFVADPATGAWMADTYNLSASNPFEVVGGTSLSAPSWAGLLALVNQGRVDSGGAVLNAASPTEAQTGFYNLPQSDFSAIVTGSNGYSAGAGYNLVTGLGTPVANTLVPDLVSYPWTNGLAPAGAKVAPITAADLINYGASNSSNGGTTNAFNVFAIVPAGSRAFTPVSHEASLPMMRPTADLAARLLGPTSGKPGLDFIVSLPLTSNPNVTTWSVPEQVSSRSVGDLLTQVPAQNASATMPMLPGMLYVPDVADGSSAAAFSLWTPGSRFSQDGSVDELVLASRSQLDEILADWQRQDHDSDAMVPLAAPGGGMIGLVETGENTPNGLAADTFFAALGAAMWAESITGGSVTAEDERLRGV